ncbi:MULTISPECIES: PAS domain-containing protein [unclassified Methylobacterium]|uniref:PAS domain-containing protein n=1 Tax=unclassified Methylobacterium TaxID=2615210 RepID=UPI0009EABAB3|nr:MULTISPECIES: PAS domain-containing protein [unclassified Methylobacterium]
MPRRRSEPTLSSASLPLTALNIGVWEDDVAADRVRCDAVMAGIFGLSEAEAAEGISWERLSAIFHPDDLAGDTVDRRRVRDEGGSFAWEHRIVPEPGVVRWVLSRGYFERDASGRVRGRGIVIDITDMQIDGLLQGSTHFLSATETMSSPVERMAERVLEIWELMHELDADRVSRLEPHLKAVMLELGREIAASLLVERSAKPMPRTARADDPKLH